MPFDMAFDFRSTSGYVTDPSYAVPVLNEAYPHTYTNADGKSLNGGWDNPASISKDDRRSDVDARIAGQNRNVTAFARTFTLDLSSGSAPGAGTYTIDWALGDPDASSSVDFKLEDNGATLIDATNGGSGFSVANAHLLDATLADNAASASWAGATVSKTFSTTTCQIVNNPDGLSLLSPIAHFRLTLQEASSFNPAWAARSNVILMPGRAA